MAFCFGSRDYWVSCATVVIDVLRVTVLVIE